MHHPFRRASATTYRRESLLHRPPACVAAPAGPTFSLATAVLLTLYAFVRMTICPTASICFVPIFFGPLLNSLLQIRQHILDLL